MEKCCQVKKELKNRKKEFLYPNIAILSKVKAPISAMEVYLNIWILKLRRIESFCGGVFELC
jgi:hypothetical protein